jgi:hypothetical protein
MRWKSVWAVAAWGPVALSEERRVRLADLCVIERTWGWSPGIGRAEHRRRHKLTRMMFQRGFAVCFLDLIVCGITGDGEYFIGIYILGRRFCCEIVERFGRGWCFAGFGF